MFDIWLRAILLIIHLRGIRGDAGSEVEFRLESISLVQNAGTRSPQSLEEVGKAILAGRISVDGSSECMIENGTQPCEVSKEIQAKQSGPGKQCDCGPHSASCTYRNEEKICTCKYNYVQSPNGTCTEPCHCENFGWCEQNVCKCRWMTSGQFCEIVEGCEGRKAAIKCGDPLKTFCTININTGNIACGCKNSSHLYDPRSRKCMECNCGADGTCSFEYGEKKCECSSGYVMAEEGAVLEGQCRPCGCGPNSNGCKYNQTGKFCDCKKGYSQRVSECKECDCGLKGRCTFDDWRKVCACDEGFLPRGDTCIECDCGLDGTCYLNDAGEKTCTCDPGFGAREGYCIACQCYLGEEIIPCTFTNKTQNCLCPKGYEEIDFFCTESVDRCSNNSVCPPTTTCRNTIGDYECICKDGFRPNKDPKTEGCEDVDECSESAVCLHTDHSKCLNNPGSYECVCEEGYLPQVSNGTLQTCVEDPESSKSLNNIYIVVGSLLGLCVITLPIGYFIYRRRRHS